METLSSLFAIPSVEIQKRLNIRLLTFSILFLLMGISMAVYSVPFQATNWGMLGMSAGGLMAIVSLVCIGCCNRHWVYVPTGSPLRKASIRISPASLPECCQRLSRFSSQFAHVHGHAGNSEIRLDCVYSADHQFAAIQISQYSALLYVPLMEICYLKERQAQTFLRHYFGK